jgi:hypothetical protein
MWRRSKLGGLGGAALALRLAGCGALPAAPTPPDVVQLDALWRQGQEALSQLGLEWVAAGGRPLPGDVFSLGPERFRFVKHHEPIALAGEPVAGYFDPATRAVHYYAPLADGVIPHEAGHPILYLLGDPRWRCVFHGDCR